MSTSKHETIGEFIEAVDILGELSDSAEHVIEADVMLTLQRLGRCGLTVMTKQHYENTILSRYTRDMDSLEAGRVELDQDDTQPPYVINEDSITDTLLRDKFLHQAVWPGLASSLVVQD